MGPGPTCFEARQWSSPIKMKLILLAILALYITPWTRVLFAEELSSCTASFNGSELIIRNRQIERRWRVANGLLYPTSLRNLKTGTEWLARPSSQPAPFPSSLANTTRDLVFSERREKSNPVEQPSLTVELWAKGSTDIGYRFRIFPDANGISVQLLGAPGGHTSPAAAQPGIG